MVEEVKSYPRKRLKSEGSGQNGGERTGHGGLNSGDLPEGERWIC